MNNKGFAISSIIYGILIVFLLLTFSIIAMLVSRGNTLDKIKDNVMETIEGKSMDTEVSMSPAVADWTNMYINNTTSSYTTIDYTIGVVSPYGYTINATTTSDGKTVGESPVTYKVYNGSSLVYTISRKVDVTTDSKVNTYDYTGKKEEVTLDPGFYKLEVWGASGGYRNSSLNAGLGGYSIGYLTIKEKTKIYIYVGGSGGSISGSKGTTTLVAGGFNGGGSRYGYAGGGGATDIRIGTDSLYARVIVAGGGGSDGGATVKGGYAGGTTGMTVTDGSGTGGGGGSQTAGGTGGNNNSGTFGVGGTGLYYANGFAGAGGGGFFGGGGSYPDGSGDNDKGGGGGSSFTYTATSNVDAATIGGTWLLNSNYYLASSSTIAGNATMPTHDGTATMTGNTGDGYAKITALIYFTK